MSEAKNVDPFSLPEQEEAFSFYKYLGEFEAKVVIPGLLQGKFGKKMQVAIRDNKMSSHELIGLIGSRMYSTEHICVEYYGVRKRSTGFMSKAAAVAGFTGKIPAYQLNFNQIKIEDIRELAPELVMDFPLFKAEIVKVRFPKDE